MALSPVSTGPPDKRVTFSTECGQLHSNDAMRFNSSHDSLFERVSVESVTGRTESTLHKMSVCVCACMCACKGARQELSAHTRAEVAEGMRAGTEEEEGGVRPWEAWTRPLSLLKFKSLAPTRGCFTEVVKYRDVLREDPSSHCECGARFKPERLSGGTF